MVRSSSTHGSYEISRLKNIMSELMNHAGEKYIFNIQYKSSGKISFSCYFGKSAQLQDGRVDLLTLISDPDHEPNASRWFDVPTQWCITPQSIQRASQSGIMANAIVEYLSTRMFRSKSTTYQYTFDILRSWQTDGANAKPTSTAVRQRALTSGHNEPFLRMPEVPENIPRMVLENTVSLGNQILASLTKSFTNRLKNQVVIRDAYHWREQVARVRAKAKMSKTVIGIVGATGAGKSSIINALLDEEQLLPTSCMRSCTAVITEISYNDGSVPYRAEVEFLNAGEWESELRILFQDMTNDSSGKLLPSAKLEGDTEAGVAYSKVQAVFPELTMENLSKWSVESLMAHPNVAFLGKTRTIQGENAAEFHQSLQKFIDSQEEMDGSRSKLIDCKPGQHRPSYWSLIKVVRIYIKSETLSTGATIVDLPGVRDSNVARARVAERYWTDCTGVWVVSPITRSIDDKTAKDLLEKNVRQQLKMDGNIGAVTVICSKTDDISIQEVSKFLGLGEVLDDFSYRRAEAEGRMEQLNAELDTISTSLSSAQIKLSEAIDSVEKWEAIRVKIKDETAPLSPFELGRRKRKRDVDSTQRVDTPPALRQAEAKIIKFKVARGAAITSQRLLEERRNVITVEYKGAQAKLKADTNQLHKECIKQRNRYAKAEVQRNFASGIRDIDQENAAEEDADTFDPDENVRDYGQVAKDLPVFEVSSRAYQKLCGKLRSEADVLGFSNLEDTQIPQLQEHCKNTAWINQLKAFKNYWAALSQLLNALSIWVENGKGRRGIEMTEIERLALETQVRTHLSRLEVSLNCQVRDIHDKLISNFETNVTEVFGRAVILAVDEARTTVAMWGAPINRSNRAEGGLYHAAYKAICRRHGDGHKDYDWNYDLCAPLLRNIARGWENTFHRHVERFGPVIVANIMRLLRSFHDSVLTIAAAGTPGIASLRKQLSTYKLLLQCLHESVKSTIQTRQKYINRQFKPFVKSAMIPAYDACTRETGKGSFARMKWLMEDHINETSRDMFLQSTEHVGGLLRELVLTIQTIIQEKIFEIFHMMERDYVLVLAGEGSGNIMAVAQKEKREEVWTILKDAEQSLRIELEKPE